MLHGKEINLHYTKNLLNYIQPGGNYNLPILVIITPKIIFKPKLLGRIKHWWYCNFVLVFGWVLRYEKMWGRELQIVRKSTHSNLSIRQRYMIKFTPQPLYIGIMSPVSFGWGMRGIRTVRESNLFPRLSSS